MAESWKMIVAARKPTQSLSLRSSPTVDVDVATFVSSGTIDGLPVVPTFVVVDVMSRSSTLRVRVEDIVRQYTLCS